jgi:hypothetical protein
MKEESINSGFKYKKAIIAAVIIIVLAVLVVAGKLFITTSPSTNAAKKLTASIESEEPLKGWENKEVRTLWKEKFWKENLLAVAKDDSMSLGINLEDSIIQLQFKGLVLSECKIIYSEPKNFLQDIDSRVYAKLFGKPSNIVVDEANIQKKQFRRAKPPTEEGGDPIYLDSISYDPILWIFRDDNNLRFVVHGFDAYNDTMKIIPQFKADMLKFRMQNDKDKSVYYPTLFIWMDDTEAKAIYRALPHEKPLLIFRN